MRRWTKLRKLLIKRHFLGPLRLPCTLPFVSFLHHLFTRFMFPLALALMLGASRTLLCDVEFFLLVIVVVSRNRDSAKVSNINTQAAAS